MIAALSLTSHIAPRDLLWTASHEPSVFDEMIAILAQQERDAGRERRSKEAKRRLLGGHGG
jgi:hypothetical protein